MDETPNQIVEHIHVQRDRLGQHISELEDRIQEETDWRTHYDRHPMWFVGAAFGTGFLLSAMLLGSRSERNGHHPVSYSDTESYRPSRRWDTIDQLKMALTGFAAAKAKEVINELVPGLREHWRT